MKKFFSFESIAIGLAMFSMFFGAGNIIFPLAIGQHAGDKNLFAIVGLILTAVAMPFAGVFGMILFDGDRRLFFGRLGKLPGFLVALTIITLLGPLGSTPRCIALTYSTVKGLIPGISPVLFSAAACLVVYLFSMRKNRILTLLGYGLTPLLLASLAAIVFLGFFMGSDAPVTEHTGFSMFLHGLIEGYNTMDLLAAFFFSSAILSLLKERANAGGTAGYIQLSLQASVLGAILLAIVYVGFGMISSFHSGDLLIANKDELLSAISTKLAGPYAGVLVCIAIGLTCLTTAIALISVFADFVQKEVFNEKISYEIALAGSLLLTFAVSTLQFTGISAFLGPVLQITYPGLIVLTLLNIAYRLKGFEPIKWPVFATFGVSTLLYFI